MHRPKRKPSEHRGGKKRSAKPRQSGGGRGGSSRSARHTGPPEGKVRIQKHLSSRGVASRRAVEEMITQGRVSVNGKTVADLPCFVDPREDRITVDGEPVARRAKRRVYYLLNKPKGVVCTASDPYGRVRAVDLVEEESRRIYCVGRLDADSTGLLLLTNDGELTQHLTHPSHEVSKTYVVTVAGQMSPEELEKLKRGVFLDGKRTQGAGVKVLRRGGDNTLLEIRLREGRNREIRRMLLRLGHKVRKLKRVAIGPITDRGLKVGKYRVLSPGEVKALRLSGTGDE